VRFLRKHEQAYKQRMPGLHERYTYVYRCGERFSHGSRRDEAMKPRFRVVLALAIHEGATRGVHRAYKHVDNPTTEQIIASVEEAVMSSLWEWFDMEEDQE
jgi:hypothetical protein